MSSQGRGRPRKYGPKNPGKRFLARNKALTMQTSTRKALLKLSETKEKDFTYSTLGLSSVSYGTGAAIYGLVAAISQGTGDDQRIGNQIMLQNLRFKFAVQAGDNQNQFRLMILRPKKQYASGSPTTQQWIQEILSNNASSTTQFLAPVDTERYIVYYDKVINLRYVPVDGSSATTISETKYLSGNISLKKRVQWAYSGASGSNLPETEILVVAISDSVAIPHAGVIAGYARLYYKDI